MNATIRSRFRHAILQQLAAAPEMGLPANVLTNGVRYSGVPEADEDMVENECDGYLSREGFVTLGKGAEIHSANKRWRITEAGKGYAHSQGLA